MDHSGTRLNGAALPTDENEAPFLRQLLDAVQHSVIAVDRHERIVFWNLPATRLYGYSQAEAIGRPISEVTVRDQDARGAEEIMDAVWAGNTWEGEFPVSHRDGRFIPARVRLSPLYGADGTVSGIIGVSEDISKELEAREALAATQERFALLARSTSDAVWDWDVESGVLWGNAAYNALVGEGPPGQSARQTWLSRIHPEDRGRVVTAEIPLEDASGQGSTYRQEYRLLSQATNKYVLILDRGSFVRDGKGRLLRGVGALTDIGEVAEIGAALRASEERFRMVFEESPLGVLVVDRSYRIQDANGAYRRMLGLTDEEIEGRSIVALTHPEDRQSCQQLLEELFHSEDAHFRVEKRYIRKDGRILWASVTAATLPVRDGGPALGLALVEDITEQRRVRDELTAANARAAAAMDAKLRFLAQISHEIRSPMNGVLGMLELLDEEPLRPAQREAIAMARSAAVSLLGLLEEVLDLTRLDQQRLTLRPGAYSPGQLVVDVVGLYREKAASKGIELTDSIAEDVPERHVADAARVRQILVNLLDNAMKFTLHGHIRVQVSWNGGALQFQVEDTGIGIPAESLDSVFETFSHISAQTSASLGGTGLGLAISRRLARLMGGDLIGESVLGDGSRFTLRLPGTGAPLVEEARRAVPEETGSFSGRRVLVVEDNPVNQRVAAGFLRRLQCEVDVASNGVEGLSKALASSYDAVFMDAMMPVMDGFEATEELRRREPAGCRVPVIGLTALASEADRERCLAAGMDDYLAKPADFRALRDALGRWVSGG
ncbi:MAG: PAS domain S-box protein [Bryobacterales bacterium]|nr:PAS domain S-box protein [Bryobacterales bacterium]